jgi:hypothetical protein
MYYYQDEPRSTISRGCKYSKFVLYHSVSFSATAFVLLLYSLSLVQPIVREFMDMAARCIDFRTDAKEFRSKCSFIPAEPPSASMFLVLTHSPFFVCSKLLRIFEKRAKELEDKLEANAKALEEAKS